MNHTRPEHAAAGPATVSVRSPHSPGTSTRFFAFLLLAGTLALPAGCDKDSNSTGGSAGSKTTIVVDGSDTMVNLAQAWAEAYMDKHPEVDIQVSGGGSGVGINSLIGGK